MIPKVCLIGSSYIGAVYRAYQDLDVPRRYEVDFYGRGHGRFREIRVIDNEVRNARFSSRDTAATIDSYDAFVVYADLPSPHDLARVIQQCVAASASGLLVKTLLRDITQGTAALRLANALAAAADKPVLMLSGNVPARPKTALDERRYRYIISLLERAIAPHRYVPFPEGLFAADLRPDLKYYQGSLDIHGDDSTTNARRDGHHMNALGGRLVLDTIFAALDEVVA